MIDIKFTSLTPELCCSNIKESLRFYTEILRFNILYQRKEENFAMLEREGSNIMLDQFSPDKRMWISALLEKPFGRGINLEIRTTNIDELYHSVQHHNATIYLPIENKWYKANNMEVHNRQFIVLDPDGYMLRFTQQIDAR